MYNKILNYLSSIKYQDFILFILFIIIFFSIYTLNRLFPLFGEDWDYSFIWTADGLNKEKISSISDILISQYNHYMIWGGRSVVHTIDQFLIYIHPIWSDLINTSAYIILIYLVYKMANYKKNTNIQLFLIIVFALWFLLPNMPSLILWTTYSSVYLWGTLLTMAFIYPYYRYYRKPFFTQKIVISPLMFLGGIIAGWTNENTSLALLCFLVLLLLLMKYSKEKIPKWMFFGLIGAVIGCALLLLSPGNFKRASSASSENISLIYTIMYRVWALFKLYIHHILALFIFYIIILYTFIKKTIWLDKKPVILISSVFVISAHFGLIVMLASPLFPARTLFSLVTLMIIAMGILLAHMPKLTNYSRSLNWCLVSILSVMFLLDYHYKYNYVTYFNQFWSNRELYLNNQKEKGIDNIIFKDAIKVNLDFIESTCDFKESIDGWPNFSYAKYYKVNSVKKE